MAEMEKATEYPTAAATEYPTAVPTAVATEYPTAVLMGESAPISAAAAHVLAATGSVTEGMTSIGNFEVMGRLACPAGFIISGDKQQVLNKALQPGESFQCDTGTMMYTSNNITMHARFAGWRMFSGEGLAKLQLRNNGPDVGYIGISPNMPMSVIVPLDMAQYPQINCKRGAYVAADEHVRVWPKVLPASNAAACLCGGMPPIIQSVQSQQGGVAFLNAGGTLIKKQLADGQIIRIDSDSLVAFTNGIGYDVKQAGSLLTCCLGGEGCFNTELRGPGTVWLQSMSYEKLIKTLVRSQTKKPQNKTMDRV